MRLRAIQGDVTRLSDQGPPPLRRACGHVAGTPALVQRGAFATVGEESRAPGRDDLAVGDRDRLDLLRDRRVQRIGRRKPVRPVGRVGDRRRELRREFMFLEDLRVGHVRLHRTAAGFVAEVRALRITPHLDIARRQFTWLVPNVDTKNVYLKVFKDIPKLDVRMDLLEPTQTISRCPYKGVASYWSARAGAHPDIAWSYKSPIPECPKIENLLCFYDEKVDAVYVDGELQPKPVTPWS